jgi:hypothetical protein
MRLFRPRVQSREIGCVRWAAPAHALGRNTTHELFKLNLAFIGDFLCFDTIF